MTDLLQQYLMQGDLLGFVNAVFTSSMGSIYYGFLMLIVIVPLYARTQSLAYVTVLAIILSAAFYALVPVAAQSIVGLLLVLAVGGTMLYLFRGR